MAQHLKFAVLTFDLLSKPVYARFITRVQVLKLFQFSPTGIDICQHLFFLGLFQAFANVHLSLGILHRSPPPVEVEDQLAVLAL